MCETIQEGAIWTKQWGENIKWRVNSINMQINGLRIGLYLHGTRQIAKEIYVKTKWRRLKHVK